MQKVSFYLNISAEQYKAYYQGIAKEVFAYTEDGRSIQFPANIIKPFLTRDGISGFFTIEYDSSGRFKEITKLTSG